MFKNVVLILMFSCTALLAEAPRAPEKKVEMSSGETLARFVGVMGYFSAGTFFALSLTKYPQAGFGQHTLLGAMAFFSTAGAASLVGLSTALIMRKLHVSDGFIYHAADIFRLNTGNLGAFLYSFSLISLAALIKMMKVTPAR